MVGILVVSASEISKVKKDWSFDYPNKCQKEFKQLLFNLGCNIQKPIEHQENVVHRNRFNEIVQCDRWVGLERIDKEWIESGYASREAKLEASGSNLVKDLDTSKFYDV